MAETYIVGETKVRPGAYLTFRSREQMHRQML